VGLVAVAGLLAVGCGRSSSDSAQVPTVSLTRAADISSAAAGYKVTMTLHETVPSLGAIEATAHGAFSPKAHAGALTMQMHLPPGAGIATLALQMVLRGSTIYVKLPAQLATKIPGGKPWVSVNLDQAGKAAGVPGLGSLFSSSSSITNPGQFLSYLRATSSGSVKNLGSATVNGLRTTHYRAKMDFSKLPSVVPAAQRQSVEQLVASLKRKGAPTQVPIDAWIDSSHLIRRVQTSFSEPINGQSVTISSTENFTQYGPQPTPAVPPRDQTTDLLSLLHTGA
jgi:hypothetical protein